MTELSELEKLYSPSYWSKRLPPEKIQVEFVEVTKKLSDEARTNIPCELNVPYATSEKQKIDIYGTNLPDDAPIFIFIHGGYWQEDAVQRDTSSYMAESLYKNKCKTIVIGYTLCPQVTLPEIIEEITMAIRKCLTYAQDNKSRGITIGGHSAGAHLCLSLFPHFYSSLPKKQKNLIKAFFLIAGIYDLTPLIATTYNNSLKMDYSLAHQLSPVYYDFKCIKGGSTKILVIIGEDDSPAFMKQSELMYGTLKQQGIDCYLQIFKQFDHFDIVEKMNDEKYELIKLILESLS